MSNIRVVTSGDRGVVTPENGELLFESDTGRLLVYYQGVYHKYNMTSRSALAGDQEQLHYTGGLFDQLNARYRLDTTPVMHHDAMFVNGVNQTNNPPDDTNVNYRGMYDTHGYGVWKNRITDHPEHDIYMGLRYNYDFTVGNGINSRAGLMTYRTQDEVMPYFIATTNDSNGTPHSTAYGQGIDWGGVTPSGSNYEATTPTRVPIYQASDPLQPFTFIVMLKHQSNNGNFNLSSTQDIANRPIMPPISTTNITGSRNPMNELVGRDSHTLGADQRYSTQSSSTNYMEFPSKWTSWKQAISNTNTISMYMITYDGVQQSTGIGPYYDVYTRGGVRFDSNRPSALGGYTRPGGSLGPAIGTIGGDKPTKIFEMMLFEQVLTTSQMNTMIAYVNNRYSMDFVPVES